MQKPSKQPRLQKLGHYEILEEIGRGGMAVVYKGLQSSLNRTVAIKVLPATFAKDEEFIARFDREAETIARLSHPNIINIIDRGREEGICYFVMEYVDGLSLDRFLKERPLTFREMFEIATQICRALSYAHSKSIVHRDLKPSNILVSRDTLAVKVADFGLVQLAQVAGELSTLTQSNIAMGTLEYMAPEQRKDARTVDCRADIFSFGIILYEMFTGQLPVGHFKRPGEVNPEIPGELDEVILRCLKPNPAERYQTAAELLKALDAVIKEHTGALDTIVRKVRTARERASTAIRRRPKRFATMGAIALAVVVLMAAWRGCGRRGGGAAQPPPKAPPVPAASAPTEAPAPVATETPLPSATPTLPPVSTATPEAAMRALAQKEPIASPQPPASTAAAPARRGPEISEKPVPMAGAEADYKKAESYAAADMKTANLRQFAVTSLRAVVENYKEKDRAWAEKAQMRIGQVYEQAGETNLAIVEYQRLLQLFPAGALRADAQYRIAECLKPAGIFSGLDFSWKDKRDKAVEEYGKVHQEYPASPNAPKALFEMGLLQEQGKTPEDIQAAIASFESIAREYPKSAEAPPAMRKAAELSASKKIRDYDKAVQTYEDILKRYPEREEEFHIYLRLAEIKQTLLNDVKEATEGYRRVIREKPGTRDALEANRRLEKLLQASPGTQ